MDNISSRKDIARTQRMPQFLTARGVSVTVTNSYRFAAKAELINEVLCSFITQLYEVDGRGKYLNIDPDGRIRLRVPWRKEWNDDANAPALRKTERDAVRMILDAYHSSPNRAHLFEFIPPSWHVRIGRFPTVDAALAWVQDAKINATLYNEVDTKRRAKRRDA